MNLYKRSRISSLKLSKTGILSNKKPMDPETDRRGARENYYRIAIACLSFLLLFLLISEARSPSSSIGSFLNDYKLLNPSVAIVDKKNLIVDFQDLRNSLRMKYENRNDFEVAIYFEYLPTGANITVNNDARIWPASLIKIPVAMAAVKKVEKGEWKKDQLITLLEEDKNRAFGELYKTPTGTAFPLNRILHESLVNSDNTAHFMLLRSLSVDELEDVYKHVGLEDVLNEIRHLPAEQQGDNRITAKRYTVFFRSLYNATYLNPEYSEWFLELLKNAPKQLLSQGMPEDTLFVHKTGIRTGEKVWADAGIVYVPGRPYLVTVMVQQKTEGSPKEKEAVHLFKEISEEIYGYVSKAFLEDSSSGPGVR